MRHLIQFTATRPGVLPPVYSTPGSAACDFFYTGGKDIVLRPGEWTMVGTGMKMCIPHGYCLDLLPRSGLGAKKGIVLRNTVGLIDSDYREEIFACLHNTGDEVFTLKQGERFVQGRFLAVSQATFVHADSLPSTERTGGFGSTGA